VIVAIALGMVIGLITGILALFLFRTTSKGLRPLAHGNAGWGAVVIAFLSVMGELLGIVTFWFGGPWFATKLLEIGNWDLVNGYYISSLALVFLAIVVYPVFRLIIRLGREIGRDISE